MTKQTVFITGADMGLGFSLAARFLRQGFRVFAGVYRLAEQLDQLAAEHPTDLFQAPLDVVDLESARQAARKVAEQTPSLDILINNAGIHLKHSIQPLEQLDFADRQLQETMEVNAFGPLRVTQQFLPLLEKGQRKLILNISSEAGSIADCPRESWFAYCMSKTALNMQSKILQNYLGPRGYKILAIHPGWMRTSMGGPDADIHPDEAAEGIYRLAIRQSGPDGPIYLDYQGNEKAW